VHAQDCTGANRHDLHLPPSRQPEVRALRNQCRWLCSERWRSAACLEAPVLMNIPRDVSALQRNALQHTTTHCNTLHHTASHCNTLQHIATHCNTLHHTASHCITLQHTATHCNTRSTLHVEYCKISVHYHTLQHPATPCSTLQHTAAHCDTLQHTATRGAP